MWAFLGTAGKFVQGLFGLTAVAAGADIGLNGGKLTKKLTGDTITAVGSGQQEGEKNAAFSGFYKSIEKLAEMVAGFFGSGPLTQGLYNWAQSMQGKEPTLLFTEANGARDPRAAATPTATPTAGPTAGQTGSSFKVTTENAITPNNLIAGVEHKDMWSADNVWHKARVVADGAASGLFDIANVFTGHALDAGDYLLGTTKEAFGGKSDFRKRNFSLDFRKAAESLGQIEIGGSKLTPELKTAWDRVARGAGEASSYFVPIPGPLAIGVGAKIVGGIGSGEHRFDHLKPNALAPSGP